MVSLSNPSRCLPLLCAVSLVMSGFGPVSGQQQAATAAGGSGSGDSSGDASQGTADSVTTTSTRAGGVGGTSGGSGESVLSSTQIAIIGVASGAGLFVILTLAVVLSHLVAKPGAAAAAASATKAAPSNSTALNMGNGGNVQKTSVVQHESQTRLINDTGEPPHAQWHETEPGIQVIQPEGLNLKTRRISDAYLAITASNPASGGMTWEWPAFDQIA